MLPGNRNSRPDTISSIPSRHLHQFSGCCDWLNKISEKFLLTSRNSIGHQSDDSGGGGHYSSEFTLRKDSTGYDNKWKDGGGRFFACTGSVFIAADCNSKFTTILGPSGRRTEEQVCFEYVGKQRGLCNGARRSSGIGQMESSIPADESFLIGHHGDLACGNDANRSLLQCPSSFRGLSSTGKTCRLSKDLNSSFRNKVEAGGVNSYESMLSSSRFRSFNLLENTRRRKFLKDFKIWGKTSTSCLREQKLFVLSDKKSPAKEPIDFNRQGLCRRILEEADRDPAVAFICSKLARHGYLSRGRGAVALLFKASEERANQFIVPDFRVASFSYIYLRSDSPVNSGWPGNHQSKFSHLCQLYNPECQYIFSVTVDAYEEVCCNPLSLQGEYLTSHMDDDLVARFCAKLPVYILRSLNLSLDINDRGATLILTRVSGTELSGSGGLSGSGDERRAREICFINIQQKLRQRGIILRHQFPEVYRRLCAYVENNVEFVPVSLFLVDLKTRKKFLCLIMPDSEPFCSWIEEWSGELGPETLV